MKTIPEELLSQFKKEIRDIKHLFEIHETATHVMYWTDASLDIYYSGHWYCRAPIKFDTVGASSNLSASSISLNVGNASRLTTYDKRTFSDVALSKALRDCEVYIYRVALDINQDVINKALLFFGYIDRIEFDKKQAKIEVTNHFIKWSQPTPRRLHGGGCQWAFKIASSPCQYTGTANITTAIKNTVSATDTMIDVDSTTGMTSLTNSKIIITLDSGLTHKTTIKNVIDGDTVELTDAIPVGESAAIDNVVTVMDWCDGSYDRCLLMDNTANFGGFRWLPALQDRKIWWGQKEPNDKKRKTTIRGDAL